MSEKYLKIVKWLRKRYTRNGLLIVDVGGVPSKYTRLETLAWIKYQRLQFAKEKGRGA